MSVSVQAGHLINVLLDERLKGIETFVIKVSFCIK